MHLDGINGEEQKVIIQQSNILDNKALRGFTGSAAGEVGGGGVYVGLSGDFELTSGFAPSVEIVDSSIDNNFSAQDGGGIWVCTKNDGGFFEIRNSVVSNNTAGEITEDPFFGGFTLTGGQGGGLWASMIAQSEVNILITNVTFSGNTAFDEGGGAWFGPGRAPFGVGSSARLNAELRHVTITKNKAPGVPGDEFNPPALGDGAGLFSEDDTRVSTKVFHTIVSDNFLSDTDTTANNIAGAIELDSSYNLIGTGTAANPTGLGNIFTDDPDLGPLMDNGGPTLTHAPDCSSLALDAGDPLAVAGGNVPLTDQRGLTRTFDLSDIDKTPAGVAGESKIDIGAVELGLPDVLALAADFDNNGYVDGADFLLWQNNVGNTGTNLVGDADGNGIVDVLDLIVWSDQFGRNTSISADFTGDGKIDGADLIMWESSFGNDAGGDADGDGDTDGADFLAWQAQFAQSINCHQWAASVIAFLELVPGEIFVTTLDDEDDGNYGLGDMSLREAIKIANASPVPLTIVLPAGRYLLDRTGNELGDSTNNDLDITGDVTIVGDGPGFTVIDSSGLSNMSNQLYNRSFHVEGAGSRLAISGVTLTGGDSGSSLSGTAVLAKNLATLEITDSAIVNNSATGIGNAVRSMGSDVIIRRAVFTGNVSVQSDAALFASTYQGNAGSVTIGQSIFALNEADNGTVTPNVFVPNTVAKVNEGQNLYDDASGNFFDQFPGTGDYLGTPDYLVTTVEDTFDHTDDVESLSLREAIDLANNDTGASEIWLPAWNFVLTRDRGTNITDTDIAYGDLDIKDSLTLRGVTGETSVSWTPGVVDDIFDLLGDFTGDGISSNDDGDVDGADYLAWSQQSGSTGGVFSADGDDDGDVDGDDLALWSNYYGNTLDIFDILV